MIALTPREKEIVTLLASGKVYKEIAWEFGTSYQTVKNQVQSIHEKLNIHCMAHLVRYAYESGLVKLNSPK